MVQFTGGIILFNKKRKLIYWSLSVLVIIIFCTNINTLLIYTHQVTPVAGKRTKKIKTLLNGVFSYLEKASIKYERHLTRFDNC
jgi:hypothetical protein